MLLAIEEAVVSEELLKYLLGGMGIAIVSLCVYIKFLFDRIKSYSDKNEEEQKAKIERLEVDLRRAYQHKSRVECKTSSGTTPVLSKEEAIQQVRKETGQFKIPQEILKKKTKSDKEMKAELLEAKLQEVWEEISALDEQCIH